MRGLFKAAVGYAGALLLASALPLAHAQEQHQARQSSGEDKEAQSHPADFTGVWYPSSVNLFNFVWTDAHGQVLKELPLTPWGQEKRKEHHPIGGEYTALTSNDPNFACLPPGMPMMYTHAFPMEILEVPGRVIMFFEYGHYVRQIFTDGRGHSDELGPTWMGDSVGHWEGDTLVTDSTGFNDRTWLDITGNPHSDQLHIVEHIRRPDHDTLMIDLTIDDPKAYTEPLKTQRKYILKPGWNISEFICEDNADFSSFEKKVGTKEQSGEVSVSAGTAQSIAGDWKGTATMADGHSLPVTATFSSSSAGTITVADPAGVVKFQFQNLASSAAGTVTGNTTDGANFLGQLSKDGKQLTGDLVLATGTGHKISLTRQ